MCGIKPKEERSMNRQGRGSISAVQSLPRRFLIAFSAVLAGIVLIVAPGCRPRLQVVWQQQYTSGLSDAAVSVATDSNDIIIGAGCRDTAAGPRSTAWELLRYDPNGKLIWRQSYRRSKCDSLAAIAVAKDHDIVAVGWTVAGQHPDSVRLLLGRFTSLGVPRWQKEYALGFTTRGAALSVDDSGRVKVCGSVTRREPSRNSDILIAQFDPEGSLLKHDAVDFGANEYGQDLARFRGRLNTLVLAAGARVPLPGATDSLATRDVVVFGLGPEGNEIWREYYSSGGKEPLVRLAGLSAAVSSSAGIHVLSFGSYWRYMEVLQDTHYAGDSNATCLGLTADRGGHVLGVGSAGPNGHRYFLGWRYFRGKFLKFLPWPGYTTGQDDRATDIALDASGNAVVVGTSDSGPQSSILILKVALPKYKPPPDLYYGHGSGGR
jgi:hypothetical protein